MRLRVRFRPSARRDLLEQILYLAEGAGARMAARYFDAVQATCETLAIQPRPVKSSQLQIHVYAACGDSRLRSPFDRPRVSTDFCNLCSLARS
jgi:plasmid stabilization system protein ParE